jgi:hypothetical protein
MWCDNRLETRKRLRRSFELFLSGSLTECSKLASTGLFCSEGTGGFPQPVRNHGFALRTISGARGLLQCVRTIRITHTNQTKKTTNDGSNYDDCTKDRAPHNRSSICDVRPAGGIDARKYGSLLDQSGVQLLAFKPATL